MTIMTPAKRRVRLARREPTSAVYRTRHAPKPESLWRDIVAGTVFMVAVLLGVGVVLAGGLIVFG